MKTIKAGPVLYVTRISWKSLILLRKAGFTVIIK